MISRRKAVRFVIALMLLPSTALAGPWLLKPGEWSSEVRGTFYNAGTYHDLDGNRLDLPGGGILEERTLAAMNELGWKDHVTVFFSIPFTSVSRRLGDGSRLLTQTVFGDLRLGARYGLARGARALAVQATWKAPMGYNRTLEPRPGEGQQDVAGTLVFGSPVTSSGFMELEAGYNARFEDPADQMVGAATLGFWFGSVLVGGRYQGAVAVGSGKHPTDEITEHMAGPVVVYRVDDHIDLVAGSLHTAAAENALHTNRVYVALTVKESSLNRLQGFLGNSRKP